MFHQDQFDYMTLFRFDRLSRQRMCLRAYKEYRDLFEAYMEELKKIDDEWCYIVEKYFKPKCEILGYCPEGKNCKKKGKS